MLRPDNGVTRADDSAPKANVLAYSKGYVELQGSVIRVIPHVQNLETCARHCDMESTWTQWRRCAGAPPTHSSPVTIALDLCQSTLAMQPAGCVADIYNFDCMARG